MIKIRLQRHGSRHAPFYRMVVAPATSRRDGRFIEVLGTYNPQAHARTEELKLKMDRVDHWLQVGAQPTDTAKSLIKQGRLSPEEWLEKAEKKTKAKADRTYKKKAPVLEETEPIEESAIETIEDTKPELNEEAPEAEVKEKAAEEPKVEVKEEKAEPESKEEPKEEAPEAEVKEEAVEERKAEMKEEKAEPESKKEPKEEAPEAEVKDEAAEEPKAEAKEEISEDSTDDVKEEKEGES